MPRGRKYNVANGHNTSVENKAHSISHSIERSTLISNERPSSVIESLRYSKAAKKDRKAQIDSNKESISTSIDVPMIELHNQDGSYQRIRHPANNLIYRKAAELISNNFTKGIDNIPIPGYISNSHKILKSTSRSNKSKSKAKEPNHRKSKSDVKRIVPEALKGYNSKSCKMNSKLAKTNYIEQVLNKNVFYTRPQDKVDNHSPMKIPQQAYILNHISQNWIDNINQQIEENGKSMLESINKAKKKNANNMSSINKKSRKSKQGRPQSSHYFNVPQPQNSMEKFKNVLNKRFGSDFVGGKQGFAYEGAMKVNHIPQNHNKSYNYEQL